MPPRADSAFFGRRPQPQTPTEALQPAIAPPPPEPVKRKRHPVLSTLSGLMTFLLLGAVLAAVGLVVAQRQLRSPGPLAADKTVVVAAGSDGGDIIDQLEREGIISSSLFFTLGLLIEDKRGKLKAGEYLFKQAASVQDVRSSGGMRFSRSDTGKRGRKV